MSKFRTIIIGISICIFTASFCLGCGSQKKITLQEGKYVMKLETTDAVVVPSILLEDGKFTFGFDPLSSYLPVGKYSIKEDQLTLTTEDGNYSYLFRIDGDHLCFQKEGSSTVKLTDPKMGVEITDGAEFVLEK